MTPEASQTRNSPLRKYIGIIMDPLVDFLAENHISPNTITAVNAFLSLSASFVVATENSKPKENRRIPVWATGALLSSIRALDAFDGALARKTPAHNSDTGQLVDAVSDRVVEIGSALARADVARKNGRKIGQSMALISALTSPLPSMIRAYRENRGEAVPESSLGSYPVRAGLSIAGQASPEIQPLTDGVSNVLSLTTTVQRLLMPGSENKLSEHDQKLAGVRLKAMASILVIGGIAVVSYKYLHRKV